MLRMSILSISSWHMQDHQVIQPVILCRRSHFTFNLFNAEKLRSEMTFAGGANKIAFNNSKILARTGWIELGNTLKPLIKLDSDERYESSTNSSRSLNLASKLKAHVNKQGKPCWNLFTVPDLVYRFQLLIVNSTSADID